jgi:hypothetical protein
MAVTLDFKGKFVPKIFPKNGYFELLYIQGPTPSASKRQSGLSSPKINLQ